MSTEICTLQLGSLCMHTHYAPSSHPTQCCQIDEEASVLRGWWGSETAQQWTQNTHTHTLVLLLVFSTARNWLCGPHNLGVSQQEATRLVAPLAVGTPTSSPQLHGPLSAVGVLICGLARPRRWERWGMAMSDGMKSIRLGLLAIRFPTSTLSNF